MNKNTNKARSASDKTMTLDEVKAMMIQAEKEAALPSLLYVTRKLGEVEGMSSLQTDPGEDLINVQKDLKRVYDKLVEEAGIEQLTESDGMGIGKDG